MSSNSNSLICTSHLDIDRFTRDDITDRYVSWLNDPEVVQYSEHRHRTHTHASCIEYVNTFAHANHLWKIKYRNNCNLHIGNISATIDTNNNIAEISIMLGDRSAWGKGFGFEAYSGVCSFLFDRMQVRKVWSGTLDCNIPMLKIMDRMSMRDDGRRIRHYLLNGKETDIIFKALYIYDWKQSTTLKSAAAMQLEQVNAFD